MKNNSANILFLIITVSLSGCNLLGSDEKDDAVYLRIANTSPFDFYSVYVSFPGDEGTFGKISGGRVSDYQMFETAYRYGYIEVIAYNEKYVLQPIDYVGEEPLENGQYTFQLAIDGKSLNLIPRED